MFDYGKKYNEYWGKEDHWGENSFADPDVIVDQILATCGAGKLLDVGCGMGSLVRALLKRDVDAYGIDMAIAPIEESNKMTPDRYLNGSILEIPYSENSFDTVCSTDCLEHLEETDTTRAIAELYRVTRRYLYVKLSTHISRDKKWHLTIQDRKWWERKFFEAGFRKHSSFFDVVGYEELEDERGTIALLFEKIPSFIAIKYPLVSLLDERTLHMDMQRESGRRSEAHCIRYAAFKWYVRPNDVVIDAACGLGYGSAIIYDSALAAKVVGLDCSQTGIEYAEQNYTPGRPGLEFHQQDVSDLSLFSDQSVDVIFSFETVEHLLEPEKFLKEAYRVLVPGGRFICSVPNMWVDETGKDPNPYHFHVFDYDRLINLCEKHFLIEEVFSQVAGGGMKLTNSRRSLRKVDLDSDANNSAEAEWWLLVGMKDPLVGQKQDYRETFYPSTSEKTPNLISWGRDYDNPWIFRSLVHPGWRMKSQKGLQSLAKRVLNYAQTDSADRGAALCVIAHHLLENKERSKVEVEWIIEEIRKYVNNCPKTTNPHVVRWQISNQYVMAKLVHSFGDLLAAAKEYLKCAKIDFAPFSPLIATKTVDASFKAGWLYLNLNDDYELATEIWQHGVTTAKRALNSSWDEIIGNQPHPFDFGLFEAAEILLSADKCAKALFYAGQMPFRPGRTTELIFYSPNGNIAKQLKNSYLLLSENERQLADRDRQLAVKDEQLASLDRQLAELNNKIPILDQQLSETNEKLTEKSQHVLQLEGMATELESKLAELDRHLVYQEKIQQKIFSSLSWRLTAPLRKIANLFRVQR